MSTTYRGLGPTGSGSVLTVGANDVVNTPYGDIAATDVQSAINELDAEKVSLAGDTMTGTLNIDGASSNLLVDGGHAEIGDAGFEGTGIDINGVIYEPKLRVNDIGTANPAQMVLHRHSTTLQPLILGARTNDETTGHTAVTANQTMFSILGAGYTGSHYDLFGSINISASASGTISSTSSPAKITFDVTPDGSNTPATALTIESDKTATFAGAVDTQALGVTGNITVSGTVDARDIASDGTSLDTLTTAISSTADATAITIDSSENATFGGHVVVGASAAIDWGTYKAVQMGRSGAIFSYPSADDMYLGSNVKFESGALKYIRTAEATLIGQNSVGEITFQVAPSGTIDTAISFTTALALDNSGNATFTGNVSLVGLLNISSIPTSAGGLSTGDVWSNSGILTIV